MLQFRKADKSRFSFEPQTKLEVWIVKLGTIVIYNASLRHNYHLCEQSTQPKFYERCFMSSSVVNVTCTYDYSRAISTTLALEFAVVTL